MAETITLDPDAVAVDRTALELNSGAIRVRYEGVDWGNAEIEAVMADQERGSSPVDYRIPNRNITIPLKIQASGTVTFDQARAQLQQKVAILQREGGWIGRTISGGGTVYADVVNAGLTLSGGWLQEHGEIDNEAELRLEVIPDFYEDEITLSDHSETSLPELTFTETTVGGDYPARVRILVDEDDGENQNSLIWCVRSRHYSADSTAASVYQAESLEALDAAAGTAVSGASGGTAIYHSTVAEDWTPIVGTNIGGSTYLTHTGAYRVWARVRGYGGTQDVRFVWDVGDLITPTENDAVAVPSGTDFYMLDLGEIRLDKVQTGSHRWAGQLQARSGGTIAVDRLWFFNTDEGYGIGQSSSSAVGISPFAARDNFQQTSGTLVGKVLPLGGTWSGAGDADGFGINTTDQTAQRTAVSDAAANQGHFALAGTATYAAVSVQADVQWSVFDEDIAVGVLARYGGTATWASAYLQNGALRVRTYTYVLGTLSSPFFALTGYVHRVRLTIDAQGNWEASWGLPELGVESRVYLSGNYSEFRSGNSMETGQVGITDTYISSSPASTRMVDNFLVTAPEPDAAVFANHSAEISTWSINREDSSGDAYGPVSLVTGDLPRLPSAGYDARTTEVMVKLSRGDLSTSPDSGIDDLSAQVYYRPSWLYVPD